MTKIFALLLMLDIVSILYFLFPPKKPNRIYGYRTTRTLKSEELFRFANKWASYYFLLLSHANTTVNIFLLILNKSDLDITVFTTISSLVVAIILTERKINKLSAV